MSQILEWAPLLVAIRGLAYLSTLALSVVVLVGFARLMTGSLPFKRLSLWGLEAEFDQTQDEQINALEQRVQDLERGGRALVKSQRIVLETLKALEGDDHDETTAPGFRSTGEGIARSEADGGAAADPSAGGDQKAGPPEGDR